MLNNETLDSIEKVLGEQSSVNSKLADSIALLAQSEEEDDSPILVSVPQQQLTMGGGSSTKVIPVVLGGVNNLSKLQDVALAMV